MKIHDTLMITDYKDIRVAYPYLQEHVFSVLKNLSHRMVKYEKSLYENKYSRQRRKVCSGDIDLEFCRYILSQLLDTDFIVTDDDIEFAWARICELLFINQGTEQGLLKEVVTETEMYWELPDSKNRVRRPKFWDDFNRHYFSKKV